MSETFTLVIDFNNPPWVRNKLFVLPYKPNATIRDALFAAYDRFHQTDPEFVFDLRYSGTELGDFVQSLCNVPTTPSSSWEVFVNNEPAQAGIDTLVEKPDATVTFRYVLDRDELHATAGSKRAAYGQHG